ncbi:MAG: MFS transporter, partial [Anaerolineae bacterium]|nr:MFS transporter [Anaerolineae bacterium]
IRTPQKAIHEKAAESETHAKRGGFREGLRYVMHNPPVAAVLFIKLGLSIGSVDSLMIAYATHLFVVGKDGTGSLGILYSAFGLGAIIGPFLLNRFNNGSARAMRRLMIVSFTWVTVGWLLLGLAPTLLIASLALMVRAMGGSATWTYSSTIIQISVRDEYLGRVFSLDWAGFYLAITISTLLTGILIDSLGSEHLRSISIGTGLLSVIPLLLWAAAVNWLEKRGPVTAAVGD